MAALETARQSGAGKAHPYEMTLAEAYLEKAREESSEAQYLDAIQYAQNARRFAERATRLARAANVDAQNRSAAPERGRTTHAPGEAQ